MTDLDAIRHELHHHAMINLHEGDPDLISEGPADIDTLTKIDEYIYRLDMPDHGGLPQVYGYYSFEGELKYAIAGVDGEEFTLIYVNKTA